MVRKRTDLMNNIYRKPLLSGDSFRQMVCQLWRCGQAEQQTCQTSPIRQRWPASRSANRIEKATVGGEPVGRGHQARIDIKPHIKRGRASLEALPNCQQPMPKPLLQISITCLTKLCLVYSLHSAFDGLVHWFTKYAMASMVMSAPIIEHLL